MSRLTRIQANKFTPLKDKVFVTGFDTGVQLTKAGIIIPDDNMTNRGIRPRWGQVWAIGPNVQDIEVGQWILVEHGRWTERMTIETAEESVEVWQVEYPKSVLAVSDDKPDLLGIASDPSKEFGITKRTW